MAQETINIGTSANDGLGDSERVAFQKCNANFDELYAGAGGEGEGEEVDLSTYRQFLTGSKSWTPGEIADGGFATTQVTVTDAEPGSTAVASFNDGLTGGAFLTAQVYSSGVVQVTLVNLTGGAFDIGTVTVKADVFY